MLRSKTANESQIFHIQLLWMREQQMCLLYILLMSSSKISIDRPCQGFQCHLDK